MTTTQAAPLTSERVAHIIAAVIRSNYPRMALPTIAANNELSIDQLQRLLKQHGYPDKARMREAWRKLLAAQDEGPSTVTVPDHAPAVEKRDPYVTALPVADLFPDATYQRELDENRVQRMVTNFDPALLGIVEVSQRADGRYAILDGQHRWGAVRDHAFDTSDSPHIACRVHTGLSVPEEADLYHRLNTTRKQLTGWDRWLARRGAGDQAVIDIEEVASRHGYTVGMTTAPAVLRATRACENVVGLGGLGLLDDTLGVLRAAFGADQAGVDAAILHGTAWVLHAYTRDELDVPRLIAALTGIVPRQLTARAAAVREVHKGTLDRLTAHVIVERYNAEKGRNLEPFFTRVKPAVTAKKAPAARRNEAIKAWAARNGHSLSSRGRIPKAVRQAYDAAHPTTDSTPKD
ncbi:DUF6551 family protein [Nocardioides campestrisoli]|uniref:DUF6551 family protein n=1 Tax=Nocardioides campestrisoli TaxID=2736757 RepID=UPI0015E7B1A7|nr:DUF6551 family protein [Nocardioides campestrisoli]